MATSREVLARRPELAELERLLDSLPGQVRP